MITKRTFSMASAILITTGLSLGQASARRHHTDAEDGRKTLQEIEAQAVDVENEADQLVHFSEENRLSPESHLAKLDEMKEGVNRMGRELAVLEAERDALPAWEQKAVDDTLPTLKDAAESTESAIKLFNEDRTHLWAPEYRDYANKVYEDSSLIAKSLKSDLKYGKMRQEERRSAEDPGLAGGK